MSCNTAKNADQIQRRRPLAYWRQLGARVCKALGAEPGNWPPNVVREMAKGQRAYPRAIADRVRALYLKDLARTQGND